MGNSIIKLELSQNEINQILLTLAKKPYEEVFELIHKIREQANAQLKKDEWFEGGVSKMIRVIKEKQVPRAEITCSNCGSLLEYGNADLYEKVNYSASVGYYTVYKYYFTCPVCGCKVDAQWITK